MLRLRIVLLSLLFLSTACREKSLVIDDAEKPRTLTIQLPEGTESFELKVHGLLSGEARLHLVAPGNEEPLKTLYLVPVVVAGMPRGIAPAATEIGYTGRELLLKYEPGRKVDGHIEITYRFNTR
ncbi:MAG TPA: hypothetical protein PKM44_12950 [Turneriella sp.]|mgnify:CR=1 FL=1|nr:hypothetical protein [Turneriella sp.]HNA79468.1 hypothetical protein [Turneriella sp.]HNL11418.1 hypothetical protein [Turneriella sp.]HNN01183.1 hypothetical protein [Turneriella sp.]